MSDDLVDALRAALGWSWSLAVVSIESRGREAEHRAGIDAAEAALRDAGAQHPTATQRADDGRPIWPVGYCGSISHGAGVAIAAVARREALRAIGIDIEVDGALPTDDAVNVMTDGELSSDATVVWTCKEAAFKCWSHGTDGRLGPVDPLDIEVLLCAEEADAGRRGGVFTARPRGAMVSQGPTLPELEGRWASVFGVVASICVMAGDQSPARAEVL